MPGNTLKYQDFYMKRWNSLKENFSVWSWVFFKQYLFRLKLCSRCIISTKEGYCCIVVSSKIVVYEYQLCLPGGMYQVCSSRINASDCPSKPLTAWNQKPNPQPHYRKAFAKIWKYIFDFTNMLWVTISFSILRL